MANPLHISGDIPQKKLPTLAHTRVRTHTHHPSRITCALNFDSQENEMHPEWQRVLILMQQKKEPLCE